MEPMLKAAAPQAAPPADLIKDSDQTKFAKDVLEASRTVPVIVDFWAPWCGPCKTLQPAIEKVVKEAKGKVKLVKINIDQNQMLAQQLRIQSIPAVYAFFGGRPVDGFMGAVPESQVKQFVDRLVQSAGGAAGGAEGAPGDDLAAALEHARQAMAEGDVNLATQIYNEVVEVDPENVAAIAGLAKCQVQTGHMDEAKALLQRVPAKDKTNAEIVAIQASIELAEQAKAAGPVGDLKAKAAADPKDFQARLDLALAYWASGQRQEAVDELLAMIKLDRNWNEGAARQQLLKFFEALGFSDPLSVDGRKRLSSILFS
jgi:putative thioredoxin